MLMAGALAAQGFGGASTQQTEHRSSKIKHAACHTIHMGWLEKKGWWATAFQKRFVVLRRNTKANMYVLFYFKAPDSKQSNGHILLRGATIVRRNVDGTEVIDILPAGGTRHFILKAPSPSELSEWMTALQAAMADMKSGAASCSVLSDTRRRHSGTSSFVGPQDLPTAAVEEGAADTPAAEVVWTPASSSMTTSRKICEISQRAVQECFDKHKLTHKAATKAKRKRICRRGLACSQRRALWWLLIRMHGVVPKKQYLLDTHLLSLFKATDGTMPEVVPHEPTFGSPLPWASFTKRIRSMLCVLAWRHPDLTHCPPLPDLLSLLLLFMPPAEAFDAVEAILRRSQEDEFYLTVSQSTFGRLALTFDAMATQLVRDVARHMRSLGVEPYALFVQWYSRLFVPLAHPLSLILRFLDAFLNEGAKVCIRLGLGVLAINRIHLLTCRSADDFYTMLDTVVAHPSSGDPLYAGFCMQFSRARIQSISRSIKGKPEEQRVAQVVPRAGHQVFRLPNLQTAASDVLTVAELLQLWSWLPDNLSLQDPLNIFSSARHGYGLQNLYARCAEQDEIGRRGGCVLLLKDASEGVFGVYSPVLLTESSQPRAPPGAWFVFTLRPVARCYNAKTRSMQDVAELVNDFVLIDADGNEAVEEASQEGDENEERWVVDLVSRRDNLNVGGALSLDARMAHGLSIPSRVFDSPPLCKSDKPDAQDYRVSAVECWGFKSPFDALC